MKNDDDKLSDITLLSIQQVLKYLNISTTIFYDLVNTGKLPLVPLNSRKYVRLKTLRKYLDSVETKKKVAHGGWFR
jgi:predicted DNA-binding transcriptional regulator AlpA